MIDYSLIKRPSILESLLALDRYVALSINQPWAYCITDSWKRIENRTRPSRYRGVFLIHASKGYQIGKDLEINGEVPSIAIDAMQRAPRGAIVGAARLLDSVGPRAVPPEQRLWGGGEWCYWLDDEVLVFERPIPLRGALGFFSVPRAIVEPEFARVRSSSARALRVA